MTDAKHQEHGVDEVYTDLIIKKLPESEIEITADIPVALVHHHRIRAIKKFQKNLELPGFRKGHVPEDMVLSNVGEAALMQEAAETAISEAYAAIVKEKKLDVVGRPEVTITKIASGNPIGFKIRSAMYPTIELPKYTQIAGETAKKHEDPDKAVVTEEELNAELERLQKLFTPQQANETETPEGKTEKKVEPPELTDEFARELGDFKDLADLKEKIKEGYGATKRQKLLEKRRLAIADAIIAATKVTVPAVFVDGELDQMVASFEERVTRAGMKMDDYLKQVNKSLEDLRKEWRADAEKRAKLQLIFNEIAKKENIAPDAGKLEREVKHIKEHYPDAHEHSIKTYVAVQMVNESVFQMLEGKTPTVSK